MEKQLEFSQHAIQRMAQRCLSLPDIEYVVENGRRLRSAGVVHCFLGNKDIPGDDRDKGKFDRLVGTTVLLDPLDLGFVLTVYRNRLAQGIYFFMSAL